MSEKQFLNYFDDTIKIVNYNFRSNSKTCNPHK